MAFESEPSRGFQPRIGRSVSLDHAAAVLGVSRRTIYNRIRESRLHTIRTAGGSQRVLVESLGAIRRSAIEQERIEQGEFAPDAQT